MDASTLFVDWSFTNLWDDTLSLHKRLQNTCTVQWYNGHKNKKIEKNSKKRTRGSCLDVLVTNDLPCKTRNTFLTTNKVCTNHWFCVFATEITKQCISCYHSPVRESCSSNKELFFHPTLSFRDPRLTTHDPRQKHHNNIVSVCWWKSHASRPRMSSRTRIRRENRSSIWLLKNQVCSVKNFSNLCRRTQKHIPFSLSNHLHWEMSLRK